MSFDWKTLPKGFRGDWTKIDQAIRTYEGEEGNMLAAVDKYMRDLWADALIDGDLKTAHKHWGKWRAFKGDDPWDDEGWRNFWELQKFGEALWDDFDATEYRDKMWLKTYISIAPRFDRG